MAAQLVEDAVRIQLQLQLVGDVLRVHEAENSVSFNQSWVVGRAATITATNKRQETAVARSDAGQEHGWAERRAAGFHRITLRWSGDSGV